MDSSQYDVVGEDLLSSRNERVPASNSIPRVSLWDTEAAQRALDEFGVCIFSTVASEKELARGEDLFWDWIESLSFGFNRNDIRTIDKENWVELGWSNSGIMTEHGIGQSQFMWYCRQLQGVRKVFETIWDTDDLVTSFDGCGTFRNIWSKNGEGELPHSRWLTNGGWYHLDQNANVNPGLETYQGLLNFFPATQAVGTTVVVPSSHKRFQEIFDGKDTQDHFVPMSDEDFLKYCRTAVQVTLEPGDFFVWDSRVIHCSQGMDPTQQCTEISEDQLLARLVAFICMAPSSRLDLEQNQACREVRREYVQRGMTAGHNPFLQEVSPFVTVPDQYDCPHENDSLWELVIGKKGGSIQENEQNDELETLKKKIII